jgi:hypothetical protein
MAQVESSEAEGLPVTLHGASRVQCEADSLPLSHCMMQVESSEAEGLPVIAWRK